MAVDLRADQRLLAVRNGREICRRGAAELALAVAVAAGLARVGAAEASASAVCPIGGLIQSDAITRAFVGELKQRRSSFRSTVPRGGGLTGAAELLALPAEQLLSSRVTTLSLS